MNAQSSRLHLFAGLCAWFFACGLAAAQQVTISRDSSLLAEPSAGASVVAQLKQGEKAEQIGKQGAWVKVRSASGSGWLYAFNVSFGSAPAASSGSGIAALTSRLTGGSKPAVTSTIGIRGLEAEDLKRARFDAQQLGLLDEYAASKQDAESAARASGLSAVRVEYLSE